VAALCLWVISLGPVPKFFGNRFAYQAPYAVLLHLPGFSDIRVPARAMPVAVLCLVVVMGLTLAQRLKPGRRRRALATVCAVGFLLDGWAGPIDAVSTPRKLDIPIVGRVDAVVELPLGTIAGDAAALSRGRFHGLRVVNGYSGYAPPHYEIIAGAIGNHDPQGIEALTFLGTLWTVIHPGASDALALEALVSDAGGRLVARTSREVAYLLPRAACPAREPRGSALPIARTTAVGADDDQRQLRDGERETIWTTGQHQQGGEQLVIDLGTPQAVEDIGLDLGTAAASYPRGLALDSSADGVTWKPGWTGSIVTRAVCAALDDPQRVLVQLPLHDRTRFIRLTQTGRDANYVWAIADVLVYSPR
jgi:hypothetical protein